MVFAVESFPRDGHVVLVVRGDVDIATAAELRNRLSAAVEVHRAVVVDLGEVGFMDSTGLGVLVALHARAVKIGGTFVLARPQKIVRNALRLVQVDTVIDVYDSLDDAVAAS